MKLRVFLAAIACFATIACSVKYPVVGQFDDYNEVFIGEIDHDMLAGRAKIKVKAKNSGIECHGTSRVLYMPPSLLGGCAGQEGDARLRCSDGRRILAEWTADSCASGSGEGTDQHGAFFEFAFGMSEEAAKARFKTASAEVEERPEFPVYRPKESRKRIGFATGTGFLVSARGHLLTNFHVVEDAKEVWVRVNGVERPAEVLGADPVNDLALLKADLTGRPIPIPGTPQAVVAQEVMALGFPIPDLLGQAQKATFGRVNALSGIDDDLRFLQTDTPIQPGNSGGPLINRKGELVGVVTATLRQEAAVKRTGEFAQNVNYAVKSELALPLMTGVPLVRSGAGQRSYEALVRDFSGSVFLIISK